MTVNNYMSLYTDYLLASTGMVTGTGLSATLNGDISHDKITRFLSDNKFDSKTLWEKSKPMVTEICSSQDKVVLSLDDSIEAKPHTKENELICWHYDHSKGSTVKGVNFLSALLSTKGMNFPVAVELIEKPRLITDAKTGKQRRKSLKTKNELFREILGTCSRNLLIDYVLSDSWYSSVKNMECIRELNTHFILAMKQNRKAALSQDDKEKGHWISIGALPLEQNSEVKVWLKGYDFPLLLTKQIFKNGDDAVGMLYLVCSDLNLSFDQITALYKKRWCVEEYHKSVKNNASFGKSPTKTITTQRNHFYLAIMAYSKMEWLKIRHCNNHFALKSKIYLAAVKAAMRQVEELSTPKWKNVA